VTRIPTSTVAASSVAGLVAVVAVYTDGLPALGWVAAGVAVAAIWGRREVLFPGDEFDGLEDDVWIEPRWRPGDCAHRWNDDDAATADGLAAIYDDLTTNGDET
jgi:hypothetical protein